MTRQAILIIALSVCVSAADPEYTADGKLVRPQNYREWIYLSSGLGMTYGEGNAASVANPNFDNVFVEPSAYRAFLASGRWPDQTIFALEIRRSLSNESINKGGRTQGGTVAVEFAVKDVRRFTGTGEWGYFGFTGNNTTAAMFPATAACYSCHAQHGAVENTFVQFYPTLLEVARAKGSLKASYSNQAVRHSATK